ncbi:15711_t:CDS:1, partial [Acaulospora morrowiae]
NKKQVHLGIIVSLCDRFVNILKDYGNPNLPYATQHHSSIVYISVKYEKQHHFLKFMKLSTSL